MTIGLVDEPNQRKVHKGSIPLVGGISVYVSTLLFLILDNSLNGFFQYLYIAAGFLIVLGLVDDKYNIKPIWRFLAQISACIFIIKFTGIKITTFGELLWQGWNTEFALLSSVVTIFGVVGVINAINMSDGIDGLAIMTFFIPLVFIGLFGATQESSGWIVAMGISLSVVFIFNQTKSVKIFMGDHGSLFLGFVLGWLLVKGSQEPQMSFYPVTALYLVGVAIFDTIYVMLRRIRRGISPFKADKSHLHHLFMKYGFSQRLTLMIFVGMIFLMNLMAFILFKNQVPESTQFYLFVFISVVYYISMNKFWGKFK